MRIWNTHTQDLAECDRRVADAEYDGPHRRFGAQIRVPRCPGNLLSVLGDNRFFPCVATNPFVRFSLSATASQARPLEPTSTPIFSVAIAGESSGSNSSVTFSEYGVHDD